MTHIPSSAFTYMNVNQTVSSPSTDLPYNEGRENEEEREVEDENDDGRSDYLSILTVARAARLKPIKVSKTLIDTYVKTLCQTVNTTLHEFNFHDVLLPIIVCYVALPRCADVEDMVKSLCEHTSDASFVDACFDKHKYDYGKTWDHVGMFEVMMSPFANKRKRAILLSTVFRVDVTNTCIRTKLQMEQEAYHRVQILNEVVEEQQHCHQDELDEMERQVKALHTTETE
jgi:hypothetical protein